MRWAHRCFCLFATLLPIYRVMSSFATMVSFVLAKNSLGPVDPYACPLVSQLRSHFGSSRLRTQTVFANVATDAHTHTGLYLVSVCCCLAYCVYVLLIRAYFIYLPVILVRLCCGLISSCACVAVLIAHRRRRAYDVVDRRACCALRLGQLPSAGAI